MVRRPDQRPPQPEDPPGTYAVDKPFFDDYPRFFTTSQTTPDRWRLNLRYEAIFRQHAEVFDGARVLDIASHDGRWSHAALATGARHVYGVEGKPELVAEAQANLTTYGWSAERYRFETGDIFEVLARQDIHADVVLCLGFFYHTLRHNELWAGMRRTGARTILIDTVIHQDNSAALIAVGNEPVDLQSNAIPDSLSYGDRVLVGRPSVKALRMMGRSHGYRFEGRSKWSALLRDNAGADSVGDYRNGWRTTVRFARNDGS